MKQIEFSQHALDQLADRGTTQREVEETIQTGEPVPVKKGRCGYRKNFRYEAVWKGRYYETKQVLAVVAEESQRLIVVTVYVFYIGGKS